MGAFDDLIPSSGGGAFDDLIPQAKKPGDSSAAETAKSLGLGLIAGPGEGVARTEAGLGTFLQAPAANTLSGVAGARALVDRGLSWLLEKGGGDGSLNADIQDDAQMAARYATRQRADNIKEAKSWGVHKNPLGSAMALVGQAMEGDGRERVADIQAFNQENNPELIRQQKAQQDAKGFLGNLKAMADNPIAFAHTMAQSAPDMAVGAGVAKMLAVRGLAGAAAAGEEAAAVVLKAGGDATAQAAAAKAAIEAVQAKAVAAASTGGALSEAASSSYGAREGTYQQVMQMPVEQLQQGSERFRQILAKVGDPIKARETLANELADQTPMMTGAGTAAGTLATNKLFGGDATANTIAGVQKLTPKIVAKDVVQEGIEEVLQGIPEDIVGHGALVQADPKHELDIPGGIAQNFAAGAAMGAGGHGLAFAHQANQDHKAAGSDAANPAPAVPVIPAESATKTPAALVNNEQKATNTVATSDTTAAEKALHTTAELTTLDRVNELDKQDTALRDRAAELSEKNGYGPMFDQERQEVAAKRAELEQEKQALTKDWPKAIEGKPSSFTTEAGARVQAKYALMDAADLVTSHDTGLRKNPAYPQELQPRERDRAASEMQVSGIVQKLDPARLGLSADAANGAPIVGADGLVESGNARTIALKRVYQANGQKASDYKQFLRDNADQFGITPESVDNMQKPVLVRVRTTPVNRAEFARQANASTVAQMSPSEQAKSDASRVESMEDLTPDDNGDFANAASKPFVRRFMARLPTTEQAGMIDANGNLSTSGYARVRNAVLAKAYGDSPVLARMTESMDDNLRNVSKALILAAPKVAQMREAVGAGTRFDADITPDLMSAVEELSRLKESGTSVEDALAQAGMFGDETPPEVRQLLKFLADNLRRPRRIAEFITNYIEALDAAGDPNQGSLLGEVEAPAKQDLLKAAERSTQNADRQGNGLATPAENTQRPVAAKDQEHGAEAQGQQTDAKSDQVSTGSDGFAGANGTGQRTEQHPGRAVAANDDDTGGKTGTMLSRGSEWASFPKSSGTLGIPRSEMPQVSQQHRGALVNFLEARGITDTREEVAADTLKATQAEYSPGKVQRFADWAEGRNRAVLVSRDNYVLDGHHQWLAKMANGEKVTVIRFDASIRKLLAEVAEFPSVTTSDGATDTNRASAAQDFKDALADLAQIATRHTRMAMVPEKTPDLMPTLVKLFDAAIRVVGTDLKVAIAHVKSAMKADPQLKAFWNKIANETYQKAALQALEQSEKDRVDDLFSAAEKRQADRTEVDAESPSVAMIDGKPYDMVWDNYSPLDVSTFMPREAIEDANKAISEFKQQRAETNSEISADGRARAESLLLPVLKKAAEAKPEYDQKVIDIAKSVGALGQQLAPLKSLKRSAEKLIEENFDVGAMKDMLRSTIVVGSYADAQAVMDAIEREFTLLRAPKNRTGDTPLRYQGKDVAPESPAKYAGYSDIMINVVMANGTTAEIQINTPDMLSAKAGQGHELYELLRVEQTGSDSANAINLASLNFYNVARAAAKNSSSVIRDQRNGHQVVGSIPFQGAFSSSTNRLPSGNSTYDNSTPSSSVKSIPNLEPSGNLSGTFIASPQEGILSGKPERGYSENSSVEDSPRTAVQIAKDLGKANPEGDLSALREQARKAISEALGQKALDDLNRGNFFRNDDVTQAIHDGQYAALQEYAAAMPVPVREGDIPRDTATRAYSGTSHSPERRGDSARRDYVRSLAGVWRTAERMTQGDPEARARVTEVMRDLVDGYRSRYLAALNAHGRVMSSMIVGPARFPVESNRKKSDSADKRAQEASDFLRKGTAQLSKAAKAPVDKSPDSARAQVQANLDSREAQQARMKAVNAAHAKFMKDPTTLEKLDLQEADKALIRDYKPKYSWEPHPFAPYELTNNNSEIKRLRARLAETEKRVEAAAAGPVESSRPGVRVEENAQDDRLRLFFDEKPGEAVRADLKSNGFRWSPNAGAWQRQLTDNARHVANRLLDKHFPVGEDDASKLSRGEVGGMDLQALQAVADKIKRNMPNMPVVHVLATPKDAPQALRDYIHKQGAENDVDGALHKGELYLFASGMSDALRAEHVLAEHEAAHFGLRAILGDSLKTAMLMVYNNNTYIRQLATELQSRGNLSNAEATEEAIVDIPSSRLVKLQGWRKLVLNVRDALSARGYDGMAAKLGEWLNGSLDDQQRADLFVADLVRSAREYIAGKREGRFDVTTGTMLSGTLAEDIAKQEKWLSAEAKARGYKNIDQLAEKDYPLFEKLAKSWREKHPAENGVLLSRAAPEVPVAERAEKIIQDNASTAKPLDVVARTLTKVTGIEKLTTAMYDRAAFLLDRYTPETVKAGMVADYGVPGAVIDQRALMQGRQRVQLRKAGTLIDKLSTLTRAESRVAYEWMNETDPHQIYTLMHNLPEESVKVLMEVQTMVDKLSKEAVRLGQLTADAYERNKFAYLRRSYQKYTLAQTPGEKASRGRAISLLGEQYKGRGLTEAATMQQIKNAAPEWWERKMVAGKADTSLKGEKLVRLERRAPAGDRVGTLPGVEPSQQPGKLLEVNYSPADLALPAKYADWEKGATFEVRDTKGDKAILWRDFTKDEREKMGEIDEARFAIAKTLHGMIHDVEVGRYLEWLAHTQAKKEGETIPGTVVDASERYKDTFAPGTWVRVPDSKIPGTSVQKYGTLAGRYLPGPVWNDLRQTVNGQFKPFGDTYAKLLSWWKTSKTALSPAVHTNNIMSNFVMADWHDVTAGHTAKALRILMGSHGMDGKGALGTIGNKVAGAIGSVDRAAAREIVTRYQDSGGDIGSWATNEIAKSQIDPMLEAMEKELAATNGNSTQAQAGVYQALQHALMLRFPSALEAWKQSKPGKVIGTEAATVLELYQSEDEVFRLAAWLKAKEEGKTDMEAGKIARRAFMDYNINAPWVQAMRNSVLPFVSYTYRAVPMMLETAAKKPHKLLKLMAIAGALNALGVMLAGGGNDDKERKLLPEEKAGRIWGMVPKLIRMPWNDANGSPVYLDIRRFIPVGDVFDIGQGHSAIPLLPAIQPGGPLAIMGELVLNKQQFTGKPIVLDTDTALQKTTKVLDYLYKAAMPNVLGLPNTYATSGVADAAAGKTDAFGRQQSVAQAMASSFGVKLGSYPADVLARNLHGQAQAKIMEIDKNISGLKRQRQMNGINASEFESKVKTEQEKKAKVMQELAEKLK